LECAQMAATLVSAKQPDDSVEYYRWGKVFTTKSASVSQSSLSSPDGAATFTPACAFHILQV